MNEPVGGFSVEQPCFRPLLTDLSKGLRSDLFLTDFKCSLTYLFSFHLFICCVSGVGQ